MRRRRWRELVMAALAVAGGATRAAAAEPDVPGPSVCAPPCPEGEFCVGNRCERPTERSPATSPLPRDRPPPPPSVAAAPTPPPPQLRHDGDPLNGNTDTPTNTRVKRGVLFLPFLGIHSYAQEEASAYSPGLRFGSLLGGRVTQLLSLNGEVIVDLSNARGASVGLSERAYHFVFSPLLDVAAGSVRLVFGPKLGIFVLSTEHSEGDIVTSSDVIGFSAGLNGGLFVPVSAQTSIGVLLSFDFAGANQGCALAPGQGTWCGSEAAHGGKVLGLTGGALF